MFWKINCYSFGDVIAESGATGVGGVNGLAGGVSATYLSYFNADAAQSSAGTKAETNVSTGDNFANATDEAQSKTAAEMKSADFVALLNENRAGLLTKLNEVKADLGYPTYFDGAVSDFREWTLSDNSTPALRESQSADGGGRRATTRRMFSSMRTRRRRSGAPETTAARLPTRSTTWPIRLTAALSSWATRSARVPTRHGRIPEAATITTRSC